MISVFEKIKIFIDIDFGLYIDSIIFNQSYIINILYKLWLFIYYINIDYECNHHSKHQYFDYWDHYWLFKKLRKYL